MSTRTSRKRTRAVLVAATALGLCVSGWLVSEPAAAHPVSTITFGYVGPRDQEIAVPVGVTTAEISVIGAHGGATRASDSYEAVGGDGANVTGDISVRAGEVLDLWVGGRGGDGLGTSSPGAGGWGPSGHGGTGGTGNGLFGQDGAGGGGASVLQTGPDSLVLAGGGGGGAGQGFDKFCCAGGPGGSSDVTPDPGHRGSGLGAGAGGAGGAQSNGPGGSGGGGAHSGGGGGGGGAGFRGGAGGQGGGAGGGGGGGGGAGSSYYTHGLLQSPSVLRGTTPDGNGFITITWLS